MQLHVIRDLVTDKSTTGLLLVNNAFRCYTLEDPVRPENVKVFGKTAIPAGDYQVIINMSARFKRELPLLLNVPNFEGVRIHPGNTPENTEGCILVGLSRGTHTVLQSRAAFDLIFNEMKRAFDKKEPIGIRIYTLGG